MPNLIQTVFHPTQDLAYNQNAAAALLGISAKTLRRETAAGHVRKTHIGLYPRFELERYLKATLIKNEAPKPHTSPIEHLSEFVRKHKPGNSPELDAVWSLAQKALDKKEPQSPTEPESEPEN